MGGISCGNDQSINKQQSQKQIKFGQDPKETQINHPKQMKFIDSNLEQKLGNIFKILYEHKTMYKDPTMSTNPILLKNQKKQIKCTFQRTYHFMKDYQKGSAPQIVDDDIKIPEVIEIKDQIMQYFGVFLCFLADKPQLIKKIIQTQLNTYGLHCVSAYINGNREDIVIDDYFLCHNDTPIFSQPCRNRYIWPLILEKAWLKIRNNLYYKVQQSCPEQVFDTFLRFPIEKLNLEGQKNDKIQKKIKENLSKLQRKKGYILTSKQNPDHKLGLSGRKYFYLIETIKYENKQLFYIRNPYSQKFTFRGYYLDLDKFDGLKQILLNKFLRIDPGNFIIDIEQFKQQFSQISIVHFIQNNKIKYMPIKADDKDDYFVGVQLQKKEGTLTLCCEQFSNQPKNQIFFPLTYHVINLGQKQKQILGGLNNYDGCFGVKNTILFDNIVHSNLSGKYCIRLKKKSFKKKIPTTVRSFLVATCNSDLKFHIANQVQLQQQWKQFLKYKGQKSIIEKNIKLRKKQDCVHTICWLGDIVLIYIKQTNQKKQQINIQLSFPQLQNLQCISHPQIKKSDKFITLSLKGNLLIIFEKIDLTAQTHISKYYLQPF